MNSDKRKSALELFYPDELENFLVLIKNFWQRERYNKAWIKIVQDC
jgi:hypothetical protein